MHLILSLYKRKKRFFLLYIFLYFRILQIKYKMEVINKQLLDATTAKAKVNPRLRMNYNFHEKLDDPVNRLLNAMEPGTYLRPHRHLNPDKDESFLLLRGKAVLFIFDEEGEVTDTLTLCPEDGVYGAEIKAGVWHGMIILESGSVVYEVKQGPFAPLSTENMAPWSPAADNEKGVKAYIEKLTALI